DILFIADSSFHLIDAILWLSFNTHMQVKPQGEMTQLSQEVRCPAGFSSANTYYSLLRVICDKVNLAE
ncbi:unnamed protein product, partial [marine sediment metagenome]